MTERDYRHVYPLADAIADAHNEGLSAGQDWSSRKVPTDDRDYAMKRANELEAELTTQTAARERAEAERDEAQARAETFEDLARTAVRQSIELEDVADKAGERTLAAESVLSYISENDPDDAADLARTYFRGGTEGGAHPTRPHSDPVQEGEE